MVNSLFKKPVYQILEKIKNEPYFKWLNKMGGDLSRKNQNLFYHYHQDKGHTIEDCRTLCDHPNQLVKVGKLNRFLHQPTGQFRHSGAEFHRDGAPQSALGTISVIFAKSGNDVGLGIRVTFVGGCSNLEARGQALKKARVLVTPTLGFSKKDMEGTF